MGEPLRLPTMTADELGDEMQAALDAWFLVMRRHRHGLASRLDVELCRRRVDRAWSELKAAVDHG